MVHHFDDCWSVQSGFALGARPQPLLLLRAQANGTPGFLFDPAV